MNDTPEVRRKPLRTTDVLLQDCDFSSHGVQQQYLLDTGNQGCLLVKSCFSIPQVIQATLLYL